MTVTIQKTAKKWKLMILFGAIISVVGLTMVYVGMQEASPSPSLNGAALWTLPIGIGLVLVGKAGAWWNHG